jgi:choline dehydrogenase
MKKVIIIGAGTAGSIICKQLAKSFSVEIFEKSSNKTLPFINRIPLLVGLLYNNSNQFIKKIHIEFNADRKVPFYISNVLGGASVMNGCVHVIGSSEKWSELLNRFQLTTKDLQNSYSNLFSKHSDKNKILIKQPKKNTLDEIFFEALEKKGVPRGDVEWMNSIGSGLIYNVVRRVFRSSIIDLNPYDFATVKINHDVKKLIVDDGNKVIGVNAGGKNYFADYVILCGGVIGTSVILQECALRLSDMSSIDLGIKAGKKIKDHTNLRVNVEASKNINSLNELSGSLFKRWLIFIKHLLGFKTLMMGTGATSAAHLDINNDGVVDTRIQLLNFSENGRVGSDGKLFSSKKPGFSISITVLNPKSNGEIKNGIEEMIIRPNYLSNNGDLEHLTKALNYVVEMLESEVFLPMIKKIEQVQSIKNDPYSYICSNSYSGYHLIDGCSDLVDSNLKVKGIDGLYICDASIMKEYVSSNIHSTVAILADMFANRFIIQNNIDA